MRKVALVLALASTAIAAPAMARDGQWYVGVEGGLLIAEDTNLDITTAMTTVEDAVKIDYETPGYDFDGIVGYDFGIFRAEAEVAYKGVQQQGLQVGAPGIPADGPNNGLATGVFDTNGQTDALSFMVNGMFDFGDDDGLQGFVGGGVGVARVEVTSTFAAPSWLDDSDTGLAWQALAGVRAPITDSIDVGLKYRYFNAPDMKFVDINNRDVEATFKSHSLLGSIIYNFGGEPVVDDTPITIVPPVVPPVVPPRVPPVVPPVVKPVCNTGPYIVYFDFDKSNLRPDAATVLDNAAANYANCGNARVMLAGHTDRAGSATYNVGLSNRRNDTVRGYLISKGVPASVMSASGMGETDNKVPTADGVRESQNRRVEVMYGPGSGM